MNENEMLQAILNEIKGINARLDHLEDGQKALRADVEDLKEGQQAIRRDVSRVDRKLDKQGNDIADALWYLSNNVDHELDKLKQAK